MREIPMPASIRALPVDPVRKVPVPWFVRWFDGKPEFRVMDHDRLLEAVGRRLCWVCGQRLDNRATYLIGPGTAIGSVEVADHVCMPSASAGIVSQALPDSTSRLGERPPLEIPEVPR